MLASTIGSWILFGTLCYTNPGDVDKCHQIIQKGVLSPADCSVIWQSTANRLDREITEKELSMTYVQGVCLSTEPGVDKTINLSYN
tara:strand:- start:1961 stop:2218 length:258 start_codon:yes stop_codon:yes gene_type:complete